jgi:uncharacterized protein YtpQ (UPF0354 family)
MKHWIKILIGLFTISCNSQTKIMTESDFTKIYLDSLKKIYPTVNFNIVSDLTIKAESNGKDFTHYLDNAFKEYKLQPDSLTEIITKYVNSSSELYHEPAEININKIVPIIKPIDYLMDLQNLSKEQGREKEPWIVYENYNDDLIVVYGEDTEKSIRYFTQDDFKKLNIDKDTLLEFSIKNLNSILPDMQRMGENGSYGIAAGGDYEASLILMTSIWTNENFPVDGDFIIAIPNRDLLFVTGSNNKAEVDRIKGIALDSYETGNHQVSPHLFRFDGNKFEKYK